MAQQSGSVSELERRARAGDTSAQRDLADCHRRGCPGVAADPVQACAWRIVVVASGNPSVTPADTERRRRDCESLSPEQQRAAAARAKALFQATYGTQLELPADFFGGPRRL